MAQNAGLSEPPPRVRGTGPFRLTRQGPTMSRSWHQKVPMMSQVGIQTLIFSVWVQRSEPFAAMDLNFVFASNPAAVSLGHADFTCTGELRCWRGVRFIVSEVPLFTKEGNLG